MAQMASLSQPDTSLEQGFADYAEKAHPEIFADLPPEEQPESVKAPRETPEAKPEAAPAETPETPEAQTPEEVRFQFESLDELAKQLEVPVDALLALKTKTKVDDQEGEYALSEILKGFQLDKHNQNKSKSLSEAQSKVDAMRTQYEASFKAAQEYTKNLTHLGNYAQEMLNIDIDAFNKSPEIQQLRYTNPTEYMIQKDNLQTRQQQISAYLAQVNQQSQSQQSQLQQQQNAQMEETLRNRASIRPEWADEGVFTKDTQAIREACLSSGLKAEELPLLLTNPAYLKMADAATRWMNLQKQKPEAVNRVKTAPKLVTAMSRTGTVKPSVSASLKAQLRANPKDSDVAEAAFANWAEDAKKSGLL